MKKGTLILIIALLLIPLEGRCGDGRAYVGGYFSPKAVGVSIIVPRDNLFHEIRLSADLNGLLRGEVDFPGVRADWHLNYYFASWIPLEGFLVRFYAGPGAMLGYVQDGDYGRGVTAALGGTVGVALGFLGPISLTIGLSGTLGLHVSYTDSHDTSLTIYHSGLRNMLTPEIGIRYGF